MRSVAVQARTRACVRSVTRTFLYGSRVSAMIILLEANECGAVCVCARGVSGCVCAVSG